MQFKKRRGIHIPYKKQGLIHFICVNVSDMPDDIQKKILNLCIEVGGEHYRALYSLLTDDTVNVNTVSRNYCISQTQLYLYRRRFYESWK